MSRFEVPIVKGGPFGENLDLSGVLPIGVSLILLCQCTNSGYVPKKILLPHQVYVKDLEGGEWVVFALGEAIPITAGGDVGRLAVGVWLIVDQASPGEASALAVWDGRLPVPDDWRVVRGGLASESQAGRVVDRMNRINEKEEEDD